ncbi:MAG TPA: DUF6249 domain-containing protein [Paludibacteraceae bacterium]|nr:DUF6249 domain-containing protein [Paludibacteraceae bacterium]HOL00949.1 DUF6249 domain-containing protein [Paludibacteraceae bacterium]HPO67199.1 DUF6249 domain-containing protein [Paludibacteraceae bacterium]
MKKAVFLFFSLLLITGWASSKNVAIDSVKPDVTVTKNLSKEVKDSFLLQKLSPQQLIELKKAELENERKKIKAEAREDMPFTGFQLFLICVLPFLFVIVIIWIIYYQKGKESKQRYELYLKSLELGQTLPEDFFEKKAKNKPNSDLKKGVLWLAVGLSLLIYFLIVKNMGALILGIVPAFVGIGYLLVYFLEKPKSPDDTDKDE